jgi:hypothetical protein
MPADSSLDEDLQVKKIKAKSSTGGQCIAKINKNIVISKVWI